MGFRFRKSKNFGPFRINVSKSGIGYSVGGKGFRVTKKAKGGYRTTASLPGTGISYVKDSASKTGKNRKNISEVTTSPDMRGGKDQPPTTSNSPNPQKKNFPWGWVIFVFFLIGAISFIQSPASIFCLIAAVIVFPLGPLAHFWKQGRQYRVGQIVCVLILMTFASPFLPTSTESELSAISSSSDFTSAISSKSETSSKVEISSKENSEASGSSDAEKSSSASTSVSVPSEVSSSAASTISKPASSVSKEETPVKDSQTYQSKVPVVSSRPQSLPSKQETSKAPSKSETPPIATQGKYVGSIESDKYHNPSCRMVKRILPENEIWFDSAEDAQKQGYSPCGICNP